MKEKNNFVAQTCVLSDAPKQQQCYFRGNNALNYQHHFDALYQISFYANIFWVIATSVLKNYVYEPVVHPSPPDS